MQKLKNFGFVVAINKKAGQNHSSNRVPQQMRRKFTQWSERGGKCSCVHCSSLQTAYWDSLPTSLIDVNVFHFPLHDMWSSNLSEQQTETESLLTDFGWKYISWFPTKFFMEVQIILWNNHVFLLSWEYSWILQEQVWVPAPNVLVYIKIRD